MDSRLLGMVIGIAGIGIAVLTGGAAIPAIIGLGGFGLSAYGFLKGHKKPFKPEDPYSFYWRPVIILGVAFLIGIFILKEMM